MFLGSGISYASGAPSTKVLTDSILNRQWRRIEGQYWGSVKLNEKYVFTDTENEVYAFVLYIKSYLETYFKFKLDSFKSYLPKNYDYKYIVSERLEITYEDIYHICEQIVDEDRFLYRNPLTISSMLRISKALSEQLKKEINAFDLGILAKSACSLIKSVVYFSLLTKSPRRLNILKQISEEKKYKRINIVTTNHDLLIESFFYANSIKYFDGFSDFSFTTIDREAPSGLKVFNPSLFDHSRTRISLLKLHGSIDWFISKAYIKYQNKWIQHFFKIEDRYFQHYNSENFVIYDRPAFPSILMGSFNKLIDYNFGITKELQHKFTKKLYLHDYVIVSGYGWNDIGINEILFDWVTSSSKKQIFCFHKDSSNAIRENPRCQLARSYNTLVKEKRLIPIKKWLSEVNLQFLENEIIKYQFNK